jgi:TrmH family RNA methyltransferase
MELIRVILVGVEHEINLGSVARVMKNFNCKKLVLVKPKAGIGFQARLFAKHSEEILENAKTVDSLHEAVEGCNLVAGTTGAVNRFKKELKTCVSLKEFAERISGSKKVCLVFGNEGTGLGKEDLEECSLVVHIPTSEKHPVLNLSHAVAIVLSELYSRKKGKPLYRVAQRKKVRNLEAFFSDMVAAIPRVRNKKRVASAFKKIVERAVPSDAEVQNLFAAFGELKRILKKKGEETRKTIKFSPSQIRGNARRAGRLSRKP